MAHSSKDSKAHVFYAVYMNDEVHYYTAFDIVCLIELGVLGTLDYCYCFHKSMWQEIDSDPFVIEGLDPKFKVIKESKLQASLAGAPDFIPDGPKGKKVYTLVNKFLNYHEHHHGHSKEDTTTSSQGTNDIELKKKIHHLEDRIARYQKEKLKNGASDYSSHVDESTQGIYAWEELIGEVFEILDFPEWYLKKEGKAHGPYSFSYLYGLYKDNLLNEKSLIKKEGERVFNRISEVYEFNTKVFSKVEQGKTRLFVRRTDFRIPFYEICDITFGDLSWKAHCTNLSIGGCFIEFGQFPKELTLNAVVKFKLHSKLLNTSFEVQAIVKNIHEGRSAGMGCSFLDLDSEHRKLIASYVENYLGQHSQAS